jgi:putative membrane-bound dehydrogenase-like protein
MRLLMILLLLTMPLQADEQTELQRSVEQQRGGRQWIDQPTDPPKPADESLQCFEIEPGCRIQLVAAEPIVMDPVWIDFDARGRMFVVEYGDYPTGPDDPNAPPLSRIVMLSDNDGDGQMDHRTVFADHLRFCHSLLPLYDGILACTNTQIVFLKDTDGNNVADTREVWFDGFTPAHPQMQIGCPRRGFDNRIWLTYGPGEVRCVRPGFESESATKLSRNDFCFDPVTMEFESVTGMGQFGNTINNEGQRFFSTNRNPIIMAILPMAALRKSSYTGVTVGHTDVGPAGADTRVYPLVTMKSNWLAHAGTHTSACGVTAYRGHLFGDSFRHSVFACEPVGHLVTRSITEPDGAALTARRAREKADFLASTDTWFRPASLRTGPDGAIYVADMYRLWVEHPKFVPPEVAAKMDWRAGDDRGRIWRIAPADETPTPNGADNQAAEHLANDGNLISLLGSPNGRQRDLGQRLIVEQQHAELAGAVRALLHDPQAPPHSRLHALWTLDGLHQLKLRDLVAAAEDVVPFVRRDAVRLLNRRFGGDTAAVQAMVKRLADTDSQTRLQALLAVHLTESDPNATILADAIARPDNDRWLNAAAMIAAADMELTVLQDVLVTEYASTQQAMPMIRQLTAAAAARITLTQLPVLVGSISGQIPANETTAAAMLHGLNEGLRRCKSPGVPGSLAQLRTSSPETIAADMELLGRFVGSATVRAVDPDRPLLQRLADMDLMAFASTTELQDAAQTLLASEQPAEVQIAVLGTLRKNSATAHSDLVLNRWDSLHPVAKSAVLDWFFTRKELTATVLQKMTSAAIPAAAATLDQRMKLLLHRDADIRQTAETLFGGAVSANRKQVADDYVTALTVKGSAKAGRLVFEKTCSRCHRMDGIGHKVGPDISDTRSRSRDALLYDILDPNRRVDPQFSEYIAVTKDGLVLNGLLISETPDEIVLRQAESKETRVPRADIEALTATQKSLMPEGVEKDVNVQQMADLLEFLKAI